MTPRYHSYFLDVVTHDLVLKSHHTTPHTLPRVGAISIHSTPGSQVDSVVAAGALCTLLSGQRPAWTRAHRAMAGFRLRPGQLLGCRVTLRGHTMWYMLERLVHLAWTRRREFSGLQPSMLCPQGQWSLGYSDLLMFPELEVLWDVVPEVGGLDMSMVSTARTPWQSLCLWTAFQVPYTKNIVRS